MIAMTTALASPVVSASRSSFFRTRQRWAAVMSPRASPRTTTVAVWVVPMPPMEATMGMKIARVARVWMDSSKRPMTEAARMAVPRLMNRQSRRLGKTAEWG